MKDESHRTNVYITETSSKMVSTLYQKWLTFFSKKLKILYISYHVISKVSVGNGNIKWLIGKSIFAVNLPLKLFRATVVNTDTGSLKSLHTLFDTKCEANR